MKSPDNDAIACDYNLSGQLCHPIMTSAPTNDSLKFSRAGNVATLTLARPEKRNALDTACWNSLASACASLAQDESVRVVVLCSEGEHFCAGADIHELREHISDAAWMKMNQAAIANAMDAWASLPMPTIVAVQGSCYGGGTGLAAAADFRIVASDARIAITPSKLGLTYRLVDCLRIVEIIGAARARELLMLAKEIDAATASAWGFATEVINPAELDASVAAMVSRIASLSGYSARGIKQNLLKIRQAQTQDDAESARVFAEAFVGPDFAEGAAAFVEKRSPNFS
jgi:enoyl-CoA hydratase